MTTNGSFGSRLGFTRRRLLALSAATSVSTMLARPAAAQLRLRVDEGNIQPIPMAIPDFIAGTPGDTEVARGMTQVITNNLRRSGLFQPIDPAAELVLARDLQRAWRDAGLTERGSHLGARRLRYDLDLLVPSARH